MELSAGALVGLKAAQPVLVLACFTLISVRFQRHLSSCIARTEKLLQEVISEHPGIAIAARLANSTVVNATCLKDVG